MSLVVSGFENTELIPNIVNALSNVLFSGGMQAAVIPKQTSSRLHVDTQTEFQVISGSIR
jgi:hypothetical protein